MFFGISTVSHAQAIQDLEYKYYDFVIRNADADLTKAAKAASPITIDGRVYQGSARTLTKIEYLYERRHGRCHLTHHSVRVKAWITLPRMLGGNNEQRRRFDLYVQRIAAHEQRHVSISMRHANNLYRDVAGIPPQATCQSLWTKIEQLRKQHADLGDAENKDYDRRTDHGRYE